MLPTLAGNTLGQFDPYNDFGRYVENIFKAVLKLAGLRSIGLIFIIFQIII